MTIQIINPLDLPNWDDLIRCHPTATPFHSSGWARVLHDTYGFTPYYACVFMGDELSTCLPLMEVNSSLTGRKGVSLPFTDFCAPLLNGTVSTQELMKFAIKLGQDRHWKYLELRSNDFLAMQSIDGRWKMEDGSNSLASPNNTPSLHYSNTPSFNNNSTNSTTSPSKEEKGEKTEESKDAKPYPLNPTPCLSDGRWKIEDGSKNLPSEISLSSFSHVPHFPPFSPGTPPFASFSHHLLDLTPGPNRLFKGLRESTRRNIRKAEKEGVTVRFANDLEAVKTYFRLHCLTRKRHGVPPQPWAFFENIHKNMISNDKGFVALAEYHAKEIAGAVYLTFGNSSLYKFGASDLAFQNLRANNLVIWTAVRRLADDGFRTLSFGRTEPENQGLVQFKSGWGGVEEWGNYFRYDYGIQDFIPRNEKDPGSYKRVIRKLPQSALKLVGKVLYRHFGS